MADIPTSEIVEDGIVVFGLALTNVHVFHPLDRPETVAFKVERERHLITPQCARHLAAVLAWAADAAERGETPSDG